MQTAARKVLDENLRLRQMLRERGVSEEELDGGMSLQRQVAQTSLPLSPVENLEKLLNTRKSSKDIDAAAMSREGVEGPAANSARASSSSAASADERLEIQQSSRTSSSAASSSNPQAARSRAVPAYQSHIPQYGQAGHSMYSQQDRARPSPPQAYSSSQTTYAQPMTPEQYSQYLQMQATARTLGRGGYGSQQLETSKPQQPGYQQQGGGAGAGGGYQTGYNYHSTPSSHPDSYHSTPSSHTASYEHHAGQASSLSPQFYRIPDIPSPGGFADVADQTDLLDAHTQAQFMRALEREE